MPFFDPIRIGASGAAVDYTVDRSLRFNDDDSAYLRKSDFGSSDSSTTFTFSAWIKRANLDVWVPIAGSHSGSNAFTVFGINPQNELVWRIRNSSSVDLTRLETTQVLRDSNAWYHVLLERNSTLSSSSDRAKLYINGVRVTDFSQNTKDSQNLTYSSDFLTDINIGRFQRSSSTIDYGDFYLAEYHYIDGQAYDPSYFTETDPITGQLIPKKYTGGYGSNGFYLNFSDNSGTTTTTLGKDSSGNGNNFTPNNFSVSAGSGNDSVEDTPSNNFCTLNPLTVNMGDSSNGTVSNGNLEWLGTQNNDNVAATMAVKSGKWYYEIIVGQNADKLVAGWTTVQETTNYTESALIYYNSAGIRQGDRTVVWDSTVTSSLTFVTNDVIGFALDLTAYELKIYENNSLVSTITLPTDKGDTWIACCGDSSTTDASATFNFGQQGFTHTPPSGHLAVCSANLPDPTILLPNKHFAAFTYTGTGSSGDVVNITNSDVDFTPDWVWVKTRDVTNDHILSDSVRGGNKYLVSSENYVEQTNTQKIRAFIQNGFESGTDGDTNWSGGRPFVAWNWNAGDTDGKTYTVKVVSDSGNKYRFDDFGTSAVTLDLAEGGTYIFDQSDSSNSGHPLRFSTTSDGTHGGGSEYTTGVTTSGTPGSSGAYTQIVVAASAPTLYYYCSVHSGMGGQANTNSTLGSSNFDGNNQSTVKVNATAGFSIVGYTGNGVNNSNVTMGHGLGVAPDAVILKNRDTSPYGAKEWVVWHQDVGTDSTYVYKNLSLNTTNAAGANSDQFRTVDANTIQVRSPDSSNGKVNANNNKYIAYVFSGVEGYSKFGSYTGNGSSDGTFVFTGFRPALLIIKRTDSAVNWVIWDNKRDTFNAVQTFQYPNSSAVEGTGTDRVDFVSNGFKWRDTNAKWNNGTFVYFAWAESPFKNARAR